MGYSAAGCGYGFHPSGGRGGGNARGGGDIEVASFIEVLHDLRGGEHLRRQRRDPNPAMSRVLLSRFLRKHLVQRRLP